MLVAAAPVRPAAKRIAPSGVGQVRLGDTYTSLRRRHLVGQIGRGCPFGGPNTRSAKLRRPLTGFVDFTLGKVTNIAVSRGARARGVGIGATIARIKRAFPKARVDHSTDRMFRVTLVRIPKRGGGRLAFAVDTKTKRVTLIGVPAIPFCE
jgi:hypothetical protein